VDSTAPAATFAASRLAPHDGEAIRLSEALARATSGQIQRALETLTDELLGTLSAFADATCQDRAATREPSEPTRSAQKAREPFTYRDHTVTPTDLLSRSGRRLYCITGPIVNEYVCPGNEKLRIDGGYKRVAAYGTR